jgi:hypothetical protein
MLLWLLMLPRQDCQLPTRLTALAVLALDAAVAAAVAVAAVVPSVPARPNDTPPRLLPLAMMLK